MTMGFQHQDQDQDHPPHDVNQYQYQGKVKGRRKAPYPKSILDRKALTDALEDAGISLKPLHMDAFYKTLHRHHYPPLPQFVEKYYADDRKENNDPNPQEPQRPLKNAVTNRKNRNKQQLPKQFLDYLATTTDFVHSTSRVKQQLTSSDRSTTKLIVELHDGFVVESVLMRYEQKGSGRASLCVSSQCGCAMGCTFCATGTMGLSGNLTTGEILEQLVHADRILADEWLEKKENGTLLPDKKINLVRNVVFMGMGEPLDNYTSVTNACRAMIDRNRWNLAHGRVTVSTVGLISQIRRLTRELPEVSLALSLHAPNQEARTAIVPTATRYPIEGLVDALDNHMMVYVERRRERIRLEQGLSEVATEEDVDAGGDYTSEERMKESLRRRAMIEYVMLEGETSSLECAHQLGKLCENRHLVVNLIPYNATDVKDKLRCPSIERMRQFRDIVQSYGTFCTIRRTMGADIASACGQLVKKETDMEQKTAVDKQKTLVDIEDTVVGRATASTKASAPNALTPAALFPTVSRISQSDVKEEISNKGVSNWTGDLSLDVLEQCATVLATAAALSSACFVVTSVIYFKRR